MAKNSESAESAEVMCQALLDQLSLIREEMRQDKWTQEKNANFWMLISLFSSSGSQTKVIVETLNFLSLVVPQKAAMAKSAANQIVSIQKSKGHLNLVDFKITLENILHPDTVKWFNELISNCKNYFGSPPEDVQFEPAVLQELDGTFDSQFSSSLCLGPGPIQPVATSSVVNAPADSRAQLLQRVEKTNPSFAAKLQRFND